MDWKAKLRNPAFRINIILSVIVPVGAYFGITGSDITSWGALLDIAWRAISNPYVLFTIVVSVSNAIHNPNTKGYLDRASEGG